MTKPTSPLIGYDHPGFATKSELASAMQLLRIELRTERLRRGVYLLLLAQAVVLMGAIYFLSSRLAP